MTKTKAEKIRKGIEDKIRCNTVDIEEWAEFWGFTADEYDEFLDVAIEALQDDWTPFSDDSAALNYEVMCQDRHGNMMLGYAWVDNYGIWMCEDDNTIMDDVVAWRPLPEPYKENEQ